MKKIMIKTIYGSIFIGLATLLISSCTKNHNNDLQNENEALVKPERSEAALFSTCSVIPQDLTVPTGNKLQWQAYAAGVQIYQVRRNSANPNLIEWVNIAPSATLFARHDYSKPIGVHYKGPTWEFEKGANKNEKVVATKLRAVNVDAGSVAWLLLKAVDSLSSPGNKISFIQRICTSAGLPPAKPANESNLGEVDSIPYTAAYLFYTKH